MCVSVCVCVCVCVCVDEHPHFKSMNACEPGKPLYNSQVIYFPIHLHYYMGSAAPSIHCTHLCVQVFLLNVVLAIFQQWLMPTAINSLQPFKDMDYSKMLERLLLLAVGFVSLCVTVMCDSSIMHMTIM